MKRRLLCLVGRCHIGAGHIVDPAESAATDSTGIRNTCAKCESCKGQEASETDEADLFIEELRQARTRSDGTAKIFSDCRGSSSFWPFFKVEPEALPKNFWAIQSEGFL